MNVEEFMWELYVGGRDGVSHRSRGRSLAARAVRCNRTEETVSVSESGPIRRSIEVEYWVIDREGRLTEPGALVETSPGVEREFVAPLLEVKTTPCETTSALEAELYDRLGRLLQRADELGLGLVPLATPLNHEEVEERPSERTRVQNRVVGEAFEYVRHCAGTHVHVEQQPGSEVDQFNTLVALDPALALVNTSPYFRGERLCAGARSKLYRRMGYDDVPHQGWLWRYLDSTDEWDRRLERRYDDFVRRAIDAGVDRRTVESSFDPESAVWTPVQFRAAFDTVEWRSPDTALPSQVVRLADSLADVVEHLHTTDTTVRIEGDTGRVTDDAVVLPEFDAVLRYVEAAMEDGLDSPALRSYLDRMGFDVGAFEPLSHEFDRHDPVSREEARELRLQYAERLERDVSRATPVRSD
jgi:gamma-glutamyl:cysteine ligase YbdK (ATP-grasp superfamily)